MKKTMLALLCTAPLFIGCGKVKQIDDDLSSIGGIDASTMSGHVFLCTGQVGDGTALSSYYQGLFLQMGADGTYEFAVSYYSGSNCSGNEAFIVEESGTFALEGTSSAISGAYNVKFTANAGPYMTVYGGNADGSTWAGYFNTYCTGGSPGFSTSATSSAFMTSKTCTNASSPQIALSTFPSATQVSYQTLSYSTSPHTLSMATPAIIWNPGQTGSYPTTQDLTLSYY